MRTLDNNVRIRDVGGQLAGATDVADANVVIHHALQVGLKVALEQAHEEADLGARSAQIVFQRKGVEREPRQADARGARVPPAWWPRKLLSERWPAQRPLPSMMMATCSGRRSVFSVA